MSSSGLSVGIVGLPNSGKSTLFNALLKRQVSPEGNYPFTTIKPFTGVVDVPDEFLDRLWESVKGDPSTLQHVQGRTEQGRSATSLRMTEPKKVSATVTFVDIAGLVKNAHLGEGLGNEFLGHIREVDLIIHVIRTFEDPQVPHVMGSIDPKRDREIINLELEMAGIKKPMIEWINSDINNFDHVDELIKKTYKLLDLITFYTIKGGKEVRAWSIKSGSTALDAAGKVHTDFMKHFIKAEVISVGELLVHSSHSASFGQTQDKGSGQAWIKAKEQGKVRLEGRDYIVQDGDVIEFKVGN